MTPETEATSNTEQNPPTEQADTTPTPIELPENLSEISPSIDPKNLVVQEGPYMGRINAFETEQGTALTDSGEKKNIADSQQPYSVEGIVPPGAAAEEASRNQGIKDEKRWDEIEKANPNADGTEITEMYHDEVGTDALVESVVEKATSVLKGHFSFATDKQIASLAKEVGERFRKNQKEKQDEAEKARQNEHPDTELAPSSVPTPGAPIAPISLMEKDRDSATSLDPIDSSHEENLGDIIDQEASDREG
jgi:hypothetical protein